MIPKIPRAMNIDRQPKRSISEVSTGGAMAKLMVWDMLIMAVALPRVSVENHSRTLRTPEG